VTVVGAGIGVFILNVASRKPPISEGLPVTIAAPLVPADTAGPSPPILNAGGDTGEPTASPTPADVAAEESPPSPAEPEPTPAGRRGTVIWDGDAARGSVSAMFGIDNCDSPGRISAVTDDERGRIWRFHKPDGSNRCEAHGFKVDGRMYRFSNNSTYYLGWSSRLTSTVNNNATFQWKSYENHIQNYPVVLKVIDGRLTMLQRQPENKTYYPWSMPIRVGEWTHVVLGIHTSDELTGGWVELYIDGEQQTFSNGSRRWPCRTWDGRNEPKWGVYGASGSTVTNDVDDLLVGTTYDVVRSD
jgi:hypothetical protein